MSAHQDDHRNSEEPLVLPHNLDLPDVALSNGSKAASDRRVRWDLVKGVCFDLDGTLYPQRLMRARIAAVLAKAWVNGDITTFDLLVLKRLRHNREVARGWGATPSLETQLLELTAKEMDIDIDHLTQLTERWINQAPLAILSTMREPRVSTLLHALRARGYRLGLLSDYPVRNKLQALGLEPELFDAIGEAGEVAISSLKPGARGFQVVAERLGLTPNDILYVGDRKTIDGVGARAAGMQFALCPRSRRPTTTAPGLTDILDLGNYLRSPGAESKSALDDACWLCGNSSLVEFKPSSLPSTFSPELVNITDYHYGQTAQLLRCTQCGFVFAAAQSVRAIESLYTNLVDEGYQASTTSRTRAFAHIIKQIQALRPQAHTLLDVGASLGSFCLEAMRAGFDAEGIEPSAWAVAQGQARGVKLHLGYFPNQALDDRKFDVVTVLDVIEHVSRPLELLQACHRHLNHGGLLIVLTPNLTSAAARLLGNRWWHFRAAHIGYFSLATMRSALSQANFTTNFAKAHTWRLPAGYLLDRVAQYLPGGRILAEVAHSRAFTRLSALEVPLRLYDSYVFYATAAEVTNGA